MSQNKTTPEQEREIWDSKSMIHPSYEMWNEDDPAKYISDTMKCIENLNIEGKNILEIGCGIGRLAITIAEENPNVKVLGVDISDKMLDLAREFSEHLNNIVFFCNDGRSLGYKDKTMDFVYSMVVLQHIPNEAKKGYINEAYRVLNKGGAFRFQYVEGDNETELSHHANKEDVIKWCEEAGFEIEKVDEQLMHESWTWITARKK